MKSFRSFFLITTSFILAGGCILLLRSSAQGKAKEYRFELEPQGSPRETTVRNIARYNHISPESAREMLRENEKRYGYKVFDKLPLPGNATIDYVDLTKPSTRKDPVTKTSFNLSPATPSGRQLWARVNDGKPVPKTTSLLRAVRGPNRCFYPNVAPGVPATHHTQGSAECGEFAGPGRDTVDAGLSQFPGERTSGDFRVLVVGIQFPDWRDVMVPNNDREPHGADCKNPTLIGLNNPSWNQPHPGVTRFNADGRLQSNVSFISTFYSFLLDPGNPYSLRNWLTQVSHDNARIQGQSSDVIPWIEDGVFQASSGHQLETGVNFFLGDSIEQPTNRPVGQHACGSATNLTVFTYSDIKNYFGAGAGQIFGPRASYRMKSYDYYTHWHDLQPVSTTLALDPCVDVIEAAQSGLDPYQLSHVSVTCDDQGNCTETDTMECHLDRPVPMDCDTNETIYHGGVSFLPLDASQTYSSFTNINFHSGMGLVRDVSQILVDRGVVPAVTGNTVTTANFTNRYDLLIIVVPDLPPAPFASEPFLPMQVSPLSAISENLGSSDPNTRDPNTGDRGTPTTLGYPAAPAVSIPSIILPASVGLNPTAVPDTPPSTGSKVAVAAHMLAHAFGCADTTDMFGFLSGATGLNTVMRMVSSPGPPYSVSQVGIRLDPWHKIQAGWVKPVVITDDRQQARLPQMESNLTDPVVYKIPADLDNVNGPEYFLLENHNLRDPEFFGDPTALGLYIWHVDERFGPVNSPRITSDIAPIPNPFSFFLNPTLNIQDNGDGGYGLSAYSTSTRGLSLNGDEDNYFMGIVQADGFRELETSFGGGSIEGDPFPGTSNRTEITQNGQPNTRYNPTILSQPPTTDNLSLGRRFRSGGDTYVRISGISAAGPNMLMNIFVKPREILLEPTSLVFIQNTKATAANLTDANPANDNDVITITYGITGTDNAVLPAVPLTVVGADGPGNGNGSGAGDIGNYTIASPSESGTPLDLNALGAVIQYSTLANRQGQATITLPPNTLKTTYKVTMDNLRYQQSSGDATGLPFGVPNVSQGNVGDVVGMSAVATQGKTNVPMMKIHIRHTTSSLDIVGSTGNVTIDELRVDESGSSKSDSDLTRATLFEDSNGNGVLDLISSPSGDRSLGTATTSNQALFFRNLQYEIPLGQARDLFVTYDISTTAQTNPAITLGVRADNSTYFQQEVPGAVRERNYVNGNFLFPWGGVPLTVIEVPDTLTVSPTNLAPSTVLQGQDDVPMEQLRMTVNRDDVTIKSMRIRQPGSAQVTEISRVKLWEDTDGDGSFSATADTVLKEGILAESGGVKSVTFNDLNLRVVAGTPRRFFITYSISTIAVEGNTLSMSMLSPDDIVLVNNPSEPILDIISNANFPIQSRTSTISRAPHTLDVTFTDLASLSPQIDPGRSVKIGTGPPLTVDQKGVAMLKLTLTPQSGSIAVKSVKVAKTGTAPTTAVSRAYIYEDKNLNDEFDSDDLETGGIAASNYSLGSGTFDATTDQATITFPTTGGNPTFLISEGSSRSLLVIYDIATNAPLGETLGASILSSTDIDVSPDIASLSTTPIQSSESTLVAYLSVTQNKTITAPASMVPGDKGKLMLALQLLGIKNPNDTVPPSDPQVDAVTVDSLQVDVSGTAASGTVTLIELYEDKNGDGVVNAGTDTKLGGEVPTGTTVTFPNLNLKVDNTTTSTPKQLLITFDISSTAIPGATVGARVADSGYIVGNGIIVDNSAFPINSDYDSATPGAQPTPILDAAPQLDCTGTFVRESSMTVEFSEAVNQTDAEDELNYTLVVSGSTVSRSGWSAIRRADQKTVDIAMSGPKLTLSAPYSLTVDNVKDLSGNAMDPARNKCSGLVLDSTPPTVKSCTVDNENVRIKFLSADGIDKTSAETIGNYRLESPIGTTVSLTGKTATVDDATLAEPTVTLAGLNLATSATYKVTVSNVMDNSGNVIATGPSSICSGTVTDTLSPRVDSCEADSSHSEVTVFYSEDVNKTDAETIGNYEVQSPVGTVLNIYAPPATAKYDSLGHSVTLSGVTLQPGNDFKVTVNNVRDTSTTQNPIDKTGTPPRNTCTGMVGVTVTIPGGSGNVSLFTIPWDLTDKDPTALFGANNPLDPYNIARWDPTGLDASRGRYVYLFNDPGARESFVKLNLGEAYWGTFGADVSVNVSTGSPASTTQKITIPTSTSQPAATVLPTNNWFLLGNPYLFDFKWDTDQIEVLKNGVASTMTSLVTNPSRAMEYYAWAFDDTTQNYVLIGDKDTFGSAVRDTLTFGAGVWIKTNTSGVTLRLPAPNNAPRGIREAKSRSEIRSSQSPNTWSVELTADAGSDKDVGNLFGVTDMGGSAGLRIAAPPFAPNQPASGSNLSLSYVNPDSPDAAPRSAGGSNGYEIDLLPASSVRTAKWYLNVTTLLRNTDVTLRWDNLTGVPRQYRLRLIDTVTGGRRAMRTTSFYTFRSNPDSDTFRRFEIELFPASEGGIRISGVNVSNASGRTPGAGIRVSYALSHAANVQARILTATGRVVRVLGPAPAPSGINLMTWDLRNRTGGIVPRGIYLIELRAEDDEGQAFKAIRSVQVR